MTQNVPPATSGSVLNRQITLKSIAGMLYSSNPFYLVSAALVLGAVSSGLDASGVGIHQSFETAIRIYLQCLPYIQFLLMGHFSYHLCNAMISTPYYEVVSSSMP